MELLIALCVGVAVAAAVMALVQGKAASALATQARLSRVSGQASYADWNASAIALKANRMSSIPWVEQLLKEVDFAKSLSVTLERADWQMRVSELLAACILSGGIGFLIGLFLLSNLFVGLVLAAIGVGVPLFLVRRAATKRLATIDAQLEEFLVMTANALKAGFGLMQAINQAAGQLEAPIADELRQLVRDTQVGSSVEQAVTALARRCGSGDMDIVTTAILIQRNVGGNLSEILEGVAHTIRERARIGREIRTLTAEMRMSGWVLAAIPPLIGVVLFVLNRDYMQLLFTDSLGKLLLVVAGVMDVVGGFVIRRIMNIEV